MVTPVVEPEGESAMTPAKYPVPPIPELSPDDSPPSRSAAMDQYLPWNASLQVGESSDSPLLPAPLTPRRMIAGQFTSGSGVSSPTGEMDVAGGHPRMPDLSREGPFDVLLGSTGFWSFSTGARWCAGLSVPHDIVL